MTNQQEIMTIDEVAAYLRISERTVYDWAQKGEIPAGKFGTSWRFSRQQIEKWVEDKLAYNPIPKDISLASILSPSKILILDVETKKEFLDAMIDQIAKNKNVKDKVALTKGIYKREELMSTGIGQGVAIPHVRIPEVKDLSVVAAVNKRPVLGYESLDNEDVYLAFMIVAKDNQHALHLKTLAAISTLLKNEIIKEQLINAEDSNAFYELLNKN